MNRLAPAEGWLGSPAGASFAVDAGSDNPFLRYRQLLWAHRRFAEAGRSDADFVAAVERLDRRIAEIDGRGFRVTPTAPAPALGDRLGVEVWVKDETTNVTGTHKARHLMGLALHLEAGGVPPESRLAIASCGNAALAAAAVARAARRPLDVFIPPWADEHIVAALEALGANIEICPRRPGELGDPCFERFRDATATGSLPFCAVATENAWTVDGGRTLAFEMIESLAAAGDLDALFVQVGGGALASSVVQGFVEAADAGAIGRLPAFYAGAGRGVRSIAAGLGPALGTEHGGGHGTPRWRWPRRIPNVSCSHGRRRRETPPGASPRESSTTSPTTGCRSSGVWRRPVVTWWWLRRVLVADAHALARRWTDVPVDPTGTAGLAGLLAARPRGTRGRGARGVGVLFTGAERGT